VAVTKDWQVTGTNLQYRVAGPGSRRIEDIAPEVVLHRRMGGRRGEIYSRGIDPPHDTHGNHLQCAYSAARAHASSRLD